MADGDQPDDGLDVLGARRVNHPEIGEIEATASAGGLPGEPDISDPRPLAAIALGDRDQPIQGGAGVFTSTAGMRVGLRRGSGGPRRPAMR